MQFGDTALIIENSMIQKGVFVMKFFSRIRWAYLLLSLFLIGIGVCLFMWPEVSMNMMVMVAGAAAMLFGLIKIIV